MKFRIVKDKQCKSAPPAPDCPDKESANSGGGGHKDRLDRIKRTLDALLDSVESGCLEEKEQATVLARAAMILSRLVPLEQKMNLEKTSGNPELLSDEQLDAQIRQYLEQINLAPAPQGKSKKNPT